MPTYPLILRSRVSGVSKDEATGRASWFETAHSRLLTTRVMKQEGQSFVTRSRSALPTTLTDESAIAAAAMIGDSRMPNAG
jgi:hypothetical protein